jgi:hypothetical protein
MQVTLSYPGAHTFGYIPRSGITASYGSSIFSFLRDVHIAFHSGCTNLHSHCVEVSHFPHILVNIYCYLCYWWQPFWLWITMSLSFSFPLWSRMLSISSHDYWPFVLLLRIVCSIYLPVYPADCWFFERLVSWASCILWLLIPCQMYTVKKQTTS